MHVNMTFDDSSYIKTRQNVHITLLFVEYFDNKNVLVSKKNHFCTRIKNVKMFSIKTLSLCGLRFQYTVNIKHCTANDLKTARWLFCIIVLISIVSTKDVKLPHHKSLEEIYYRYCEFSRVKKKHFNDKKFEYWI